MSWTCGMHPYDYRDYLILRALWELEEPYFESDLKRMICRVQRRDLPEPDGRRLQFTQIFDENPLIYDAGLTTCLHQLEEEGLVDYDIRLTFDGETRLSNLNRMRLGITSYTQYSNP